MEKKIRPIAAWGDMKTVEITPGIFRTTMAYNEQSMLCHFKAKKGVIIPMHHHEAVQNGYIIKGKVRFTRGDDSTSIAEERSGYAFGPNEGHAAEILEDSEIIECFTPMRPDYVD